jgi:acetyl-CoA carboxylase carboxyltransferase component
VGNKDLFLPKAKKTLKKNIMSTQDKINELIRLREKAKLGGGEKRIESQHGKGKHTARERIDILFG